MPQYMVQEPVKLGRQYQPGEMIELSEEDAEPLLILQIIAVIVWPKKLGHNRKPQVDPRETLF